MLNKKSVSLVMVVLYTLTLVFASTGCAEKKENPQTTTQTQSGTTGENTPVTTVQEESSTDRPVFTGERVRTSIAVEYKPAAYEKKVKAYKVADNLSNIANLAQFGDFTPAQREQLAKDSFVVMPSGEEQLFYIYENNTYLTLPSFVTVDSVLQVYHIFFDYSLRTLEAEKLLGTVEQLTERMLKKSIHVYEQVKDPRVKQLALKNIAYFAVAQKALEKEIPSDLPDEAKKLAEKEYALVSGQEGFQDSALYPFQMDYSQYKPRGHYTRSHDFERYFKAMMWYGQVPFPSFTKEGEEMTLDVESFTQALLMTYSVFLNYGEGPDTELWESIYDPTAFYVGCADDLTIYQIKDLLLKVYGAEPEPDLFMKEDRIAQLYEEIKKLPEPRIQAKWTTVDTPVQKQFRFMGQRYIPDSEILQKIVDPILRPMPSGLDVMGVLGSERAYDLQTNQYEVQKQWPEYPGKFKELREQFSGLSDQTWQSNMYYGWMWVLKSLLHPFEEGYPSFMTNTAWTDKSLNTALGSWSELRHDTILYAKQSGAECGGDGPPAVIRSYVEPNIPVYEKLLWLTEYSMKNLEEREILPEDMKNRMLNFQDLLQFLIQCSEKELRNEELGEAEYNNLLTYGGTLEHLTSSLVENGARWFEITSDTDKNMAVIADVHTVPGNYLEVGVGSAAQIFVVVPIGGKLYLTRGAIFNYYEFISNKRLTDEEWQKQLKENRQPPRPDWTDTFEKGEKDEIPVPKQPYNSGC
jgi:Protein of unknown function (DUF3160)